MKEANKSKYGADQNNNADILGLVARNFKEYFCFFGLTLFLNAIFHEYLKLKKTRYHYINKNENNITCTTLLSSSVRSSNQGPSYKGCGHYVRKWWRTIIRAQVRLLHDKLLFRIKCTVLVRWLFYQLFPKFGHLICPFSVCRVLICNGWTKSCCSRRNTRLCRI